MRQVRERAGGSADTRLVGVDDVEESEVTDSDFQALLAAHSYRTFRGDTPLPKLAAALRRGDPLPPNVVAAHVARAVAEVALAPGIDFDNFDKPGGGGDFVASSALATVAAVAEEEGAAAMLLRAARGGGVSDRGASIVRI